jgi:hypothetical protein
MERTYIEGGRHEDERFGSATAEEEHTGWSSHSRIAYALVELVDRSKEGNRHFGRIPLGMNVEVLVFRLSGMNVN